MTVRADGDWLRLEGECGVEEAETLTGLLQARDWRGVDLGQCRLAHSAVVQALLAYRVPIAEGGGSDFIRDLLVPCLQAARAAPERQGSDEAIQMQFEDGAEAPPS